MFTWGITLQAMDTYRRLEEDLEKANFLLWYERFHGETPLYADNNVFIALQAKYKHCTAWIDTLFSIEKRF